VTPNNAQWGAGLCFVYAFEDVVRNNVIADNSASHGGGGASFHESGCAFANNTVALGSSGVYRDSATSTLPSLSHNCVHGNTYQVYTGITPGLGDIASDPLFVNRVSGDCHLASRLPCINGARTAPQGPDRSTTTIC